MRSIASLLILIFAASCGQDGGGGSVGSKGCNLNGRAVACESIRGTDGQGIDLLEALIEVPVEITDSVITFRADRSTESEGRRISCDMAVRSGETYRYTLRGNRLMVSTENGSFEFSRLTSGSGIIGTWAWRGYVDQGTHMIRQMTFVNNTRMIYRTSCEL